MSSISQREVGLDTASFAAALRAALRQDPDVIFVGEIRDEETMEIALKAAETGHLVHGDAAHERRGAHRQPHARADARRREREPHARSRAACRASSRSGCCPRADGAGVVLAAEVLVASHSVKESIRRPENNPPLKSLMEKGTHPYGMRTFQMSIAQAARAGRHRRGHRQRGARHDSSALQPRAPARRASSDGGARRRAWRATRWATTMSASSSAAATPSSTTPDAQRRARRRPRRAAAWTSTSRAAAAAARSSCAICSRAGSSSAPNAARSAMRLPRDRHQCFAHVACAPPRPPPCACPPGA